MSIGERHDRVPIEEPAGVVHVAVRQVNPYCQDDEPKFRTRQAGQCTFPRRSDALEHTCDDAEELRRTQYLVPTEAGLLTFGLICL